MDGTWRKRIRNAATVAGLLAVAGLAVTRDRWLPLAEDWVQVARGAVRGEAHDEHDGHDHAGHDHAGHTPEHGGDADAKDGDHVQISEQAQKNIGLAVTQLEPSTFHRTMTVPAMVIEKPGRSDVQVTAPLAGVVTRIHPLKGETVEPGQPLFELRLTHEEVVQAQTELLKTVEELDVVRREIERLEGITSGSIAHKDVLARKYEQQKLEGAQRAQVQALLLHGLTEAQVESIQQTRRLLKDVTIHAPAANSQRPSSDVQPVFELEELNVGQGQHVQVGQALCVLGDHVSLYIEGRAFEREAELFSRAMRERWAVTATFDRARSGADAKAGLRVAYVSNKVDSESRTFQFYVELPNEMARAADSHDGHRFVDWRFKPGQRVQLLVPVEQWADRLVIPAEAIVKDGAEAFVFQRNGDRFQRRPVHVEYQDQRYVVLANDGSVFAGESVVVRGAYQLQMAMKNKAGGAIDPHAGHNH
jgi:multidrug efflux pump subunit AcrA (membrane-fusion protein)